MTLELDQKTADDLLKMAKRRADAHIREYPDLGGKLVVPLISHDDKEEFTFDVNESFVSLTKVTYQTRARTSVILARLDLAGAPHRNPDDTEVGIPHLHLYREGFGDKWAYAVPADKFSDISDKKMTIHDFLNYCGVTDHPVFKMSLFT